MRAWGGHVRNPSIDGDRTNTVNQSKYVCKGLTREGFWEEEAQERPDDKRRDDPEKWWREQWFAAQNAAALGILAKMEGVPGIDINAQTSKPPWKPIAKRASPWEKPEPHQRTALSLAAGRGDTEAVRLLLNLG